MTTLMPGLEPVGQILPPDPFAIRVPQVTARWRDEAEFILSALEAGRGKKPLPRAHHYGSGRIRWHAIVGLKLFSDEPDAVPRVLHARDLTRRNMSFITGHRLPLGYGGILHLDWPDQEHLAIACTVHRCHETVLGWFEGLLHFNREQHELHEMVVLDATQSPTLRDSP